MKEFVSSESLLNWLQMLLDEYMNETKNGIEDRVTHDHLIAMLGCKEMVEALIGVPVNLQKDGKVTTGF